MASQAAGAPGWRLQNFTLPETGGSIQPVQIAAAGSGAAAPVAGSVFLPPRNSENGAAGTVESRP